LALAARSDVSKWPSPRQHHRADARAVPAQRVDHRRSLAQGAQEIALAPGDQERSPYVRDMADGAELGGAVRVV
jgi:hypothetical protein